MKTKKTRIVNYLKLGIFLFGISLLLWNCEKEDITSETPEVLTQKKSPKIQTLNLEKAKKIPDFLEISNAFKTSYLFDKEIRKDDLKFKSKQNHDFAIDFNSFKRIENDDLVSYTFLIKRNSVEEEHLTENLIIEKRNGKIRGYIMKYREASYYEKDNHKHLRAKISRTPYKESLEDVLKKINGNHLAKVSCEYEMVATARNCSVHGMFSTDPQCINYQNNNYWDYSMVPVCLDSGGGDDGGFTDFGDTGEGGGGGSSSGGGSTSPIIPCEDVIHGCDKIPHLKLANDLGITDQNQIDFLENNPILVDEMNTFRIENNYSTESENYLKDAIASFTIGVNQDYLNQMSVSEKSIYNSMSKFKQAAYLMNAQKAVWKSESLYPNSLYNGTGDAFRHAFFNGLNSILLGVNLAESLATAHEAKPLDPDYPNHFKENQMDLFNNQVGRSRKNWFSDGFWSLDESILDALHNGKLRYLSNLLGGGNSGKATNQSQLTPTN